VLFVNNFLIRVTER